jgi:hypothetical protein
MYLLHCPQGHTIQVSTAAAGNSVRCPECEAVVQVPKLGELRKLPVVAEGARSARGRDASGSGFAARLVFGLLVLVAIIAGGISAYGAMRWFNLPIPMTSAEHIQMGREEIASRVPAELIVDWQQYESMGLGEQAPFPYQRMQNLRDHWLRVCLIPLGIAAASIAVGIFVVMLGSRRKVGADT